MRTGIREPLAPNPRRGLPRQTFQPKEKTMNWHAKSPSPVLALVAKTAADLMTPTIVTIPAAATVPEAVALLIEKNLSAVPVVDQAGKPVGVLSRSDIVAHDRRQYEHLQPGREYYEQNNFIVRLRETLPNVYAIEQARVVRVRDIITPVIFSVAPYTPASTVVDALLALTVHRLFVTAEDGRLAGVISATDVLRHLHQPRAEPGPADEAEVLCVADDLDVI
jgi:CBS domain-containing membrane protein